MRFRKKPVVVEAMQWSGQAEDWEAVEAFTDSTVIHDAGAHGVTIATLEGRMNVMPGDWIIKGIKGEFYPCKPDIFNATYEPMEEGDPVDAVYDKTKRDPEYREAFNREIDGLGMPWLKAEEGEDGE